MVSRYIISLTQLPLLSSVLMLLVLNALFPNWVAGSLISMYLHFRIACYLKMKTQETNKNEKSTTMMTGDLPIITLCSNKAYRQGSGGATLWCDIGVWHYQVTPTVNDAMTSKEGVHTGDHKCRGQWINWP